MIEAEYTCDKINDAAMERCLQLESTSALKTVVHTAKRNVEYNPDLETVQWRTFY